MTESPASRAAKRMKLVGETSYGKPKVSFGNIEKMQFHIHDFANINHKIGEHFKTNTIKAHGHLWKLKIYPRGNIQSNTDTEHVSIYLHCMGTDPVLAKARIRTKTKKLGKNSHEYARYVHGHQNFAERDDIIGNDCNKDGTLTITVELRVATEKRSVWFPNSTSNDDVLYTIFNSADTSDVTFIIGSTGKEFYGHKCVLAVRAKELYELVLVEESSNIEGNDNNVVAIPDVDEKAFETLLEFVYTGKEPEFNDDDDDDEEIAKSIFITADRFGCKDLKLYMESILIEKFLIPSNVAALLLFADSHSCALLKEATMNMYIEDCKPVIESKDDWSKLKESNDLLVELLVYATSASSGRKKYSSVVDDGNGSIEDADEFDVTSLRERLQKVGLDVDGSREYLLELWKNYLRPVAL
ncbi:hypothetical protein FRACYDRAFT_238463 [Fragilariopsis cylindrus CCMP1102]|uniref:POZ domain-containing protein n=1 Tax=Fragilariopsis cylindrus CCMP1102 TaxID=635003 RepID=A0A1E7FIM2_9STRA|nr:hypothetical protein FRACYDRAFT_238463 [Fragilariopsis cylindrus CCMP1102]|eukprot:OEU18029.1 hypothetical protein FRACYDRAFT_238463 [Fragilariopsis cylindrus CCMP1102]